MPNCPNGPRKYIGRKKVGWRAGFVGPNSPTGLYLIQHTDGSFTTVTVQFQEFPDKPGVVLTVNVDGSIYDLDGVHALPRAPTGKEVKLSYGPITPPETKKRLLR